ncbi:hypothetical protein PIIN_05195 [Serendipita indica DSM 11827]|uniref:Steroid 5-alpha reductase C-terminal domain-containing protein n=1 Tax=Serendipita indica (strain DSM 11827) TaxID=1109443 RepID=G4TIW7_SERID|nr:hypothetical protein PIIN_05195 [Serendipita indica DSM 11827]
MPTIFSRLWVPAAFAFGTQIAAASIFVPLKSEKYYDFLGGTGHIIAAGISLYGPTLYQHLAASKPLATYRFPALSTFAPRQLVITAAFGFWAARLAVFLFHRISKEGKDSRFDQIKQNAPRFFMAWVIQGAWISIVGLPVWLTNAVPGVLTRPWGRPDVALLGAAALCLGTEMLADYQKSAWRAEKNQGKHQEKFINRGLWSLSRHPNYVAEIGLHTCIWGLATRSLYAPGVPGIAVAIAATSPLFTYYILRYLSGVPLLERAANKKWRDDPNWKHYKQTTPVFWPWAPIYD